MGSQYVLNTPRATYKVNGLNSNPCMLPNNFFFQLLVMFSKYHDHQLILKLKGVVVEWGLAVEQHSKFPVILRVYQFDMY